MKLFFLLSLLLVSGVTLAGFDEEKIEASRDWLRLKFVNSDGCKVSISGLGEVTYFTPVGEIFSGDYNGNIVSSSEVKYVFKQSKKDLRVIERSGDVFSFKRLNKKKLVYECLNLVKQEKK